MVSKESLRDGEENGMVGFPNGKDFLQEWGGENKKKGRGELSCRALPCAVTNEGEREAGGTFIMGGCGPHNT